MLEICQNHLDATGSFSTEIENLLAYAVLVRIYAEFELLVESTIEDKLSCIEDPCVVETFNSLVENRYRGMLSSRLSEFLGSFGNNYKTDFDEKRRQNQRAETFYNNIVTNRHDTAHSTGSNASFVEVKRFYEEGHIVLDFFRETLTTIDVSRILGKP